MHNRQIKLFRFPKELIILFDNIYVYVCVLGRDRFRMKNMAINVIAACLLLHLCGFQFQPFFSYRIEYIGEGKRFSPQTYSLWPLGLALISIYIENKFDFWCSVRFYGYYTKQ